MAKGKADINLSLSPNFISKGRVCCTVEIDKARIYEKAPSKTSASKSVLYPFDKTTWNMALISIGCIFGTFCLIGLMHSTNENQSLATISYTSFGATIGPMFQEFDCINRMYKLSLRGSYFLSSLVIIWLFAGMLLTMGYASFLKSSFVIKEYNPVSSDVIEAMDNDEPFHTYAEAYQYYSFIAPTDVTGEFQAMVDKIDRDGSITWYS